MLPQQTPVAESSVREEIEGILAEMAAAFNTGNGASMFDYYGHNAIQIRRHGVKRVVAGRGNIMQLFHDGGRTVENSGEVEFEIINIHTCPCCGAGKMVVEPCMTSVVVTWIFVTEERNTEHRRPETSLLVFVRKDDGLLEVMHVAV